MHHSLAENGSGGKVLICVDGIVIGADAGEGFYVLRVKLPGKRGFIADVVCSAHAETLFAVKKSMQRYDIIRMRSAAWAT